MDIALAGMILSLLLTIIVGGFILLFPLSRRLAALLEQRVRERSQGSAAERLEPLREALHALQAEVERLAERQEFMERVLEQRSEREALPSGRASATDPD